MHRHGFQDQAKETVLTSDPWEFSFHSKLRTVALPYTSKDTVLLAVAERYGAEYIAIVDKTIRHEKYRPLLNNQFPDYLEPFYQSSNLILVKFIE
jgi:hypothetical protein